VRWLSARWWHLDGALRVLELQQRPASSPPGQRSRHRVLSRSVQVCHYADPGVEALHLPARHGTSRRCRPTFVRFLPQTGRRKVRDLIGRHVPDSSSDPSQGQEQDKRNIHIAWNQASTVNIHASGGLVAINLGDLPCLSAREKVRGRPLPMQTMICPDDQIQRHRLMGRACEGLLNEENEVVLRARVPRQTPSPGRKPQER
jgi:hypothetical protein